MHPACRREAVERKLHQAVAKIGRCWQILLATMQCPHFTYHGSTGKGKMPSPFTTLDRSALLLTQVQHDQVLRCGYCTSSFCISSGTTRLLSQCPHLASDPPKFDSPTVVQPMQVIDPTQHRGINEQCFRYMRTSTTPISSVLISNLMGRTRIRPGGRGVKGFALCGCILGDHAYLVDRKHCTCLRTSVNRQGSFLAIALVILKS